MSSVQVVLQAPVESQTYALQDCVVPVWQVPRPSHLPATVSTPAVQVFVPQTVLALYSWQAPFPSQEPLVLQLGAS